MLEVEGDCGKKKRLRERVVVEAAPTDTAWVGWFVFMVCVCGFC